MKVFYLSQFTMRCLHNKATQWRNMPRLEGKELRKKVLEENITEIKLENAHKFFDGLIIDTYDEVIEDIKQRFSEKKPREVKPELNGFYGDFQGAK